MAEDNNLSTKSNLKSKLNVLKEEVEMAQVTLSLRQKDIMNRITMCKALELLTTAADYKEQMIEIKKLNDKYQTEFDKVNSIYDTANDSYNKSVTKNSFIEIDIDDDDDENNNKKKTKIEKTPKTPKTLFQDTPLDNKYNNDNNKKSNKSKELITIENQVKTNEKNNKEVDKAASKKSKKSLNKKSKAEQEAKDVWESEYTFFIGENSNTDEITVKPPQFLNQISHTIAGYPHTDTDGIDVALKFNTAGEDITTITCKKLKQLKENLLTAVKYLTEEQKKDEYFQVAMWLDNIEHALKKYNTFGKLKGSSSKIASAGNDSDSGDDSDSEDDE